MFQEFDDELDNILNAIDNLKSRAYLLDLDLKDKDEISTRLYVAQTILNDISETFIYNKAKDE